MESPESVFELQPGLTFVAPDGPYKDRLMTLKRVDNTKPDRWIVESDDGKEWAAPGVRLREVLAQQAKEAQVPQEAPRAGPAVPEAAPVQANAAPPGPAAPAVPEKASSEPAPSPAQEAPAPVASAPAVLDFAHTPVKLVIKLWSDEGHGRTAWVGADLPDHNAVTTTLNSEQVAQLVKPLAGVLAQLEAEFPQRQAKIVAAMASEQRTAYVPPARTTPAPAARSKPAGPVSKGTPLTTVPPGADKPKPTTGPSPERQAYLATIKQPDMFAAVTGTASAPATPSESQ